MTIPTGAAACAKARTYVGQPYVFGGNPYGPPGTLHSDCSGLIDRVQADLGTEFPGRPTTFSLVQMGTPVATLAEAPVGAWLFYEDYGSGPNHVTIYLGDGMLIEDPHTGADVHIIPVYDGITEIRAFWAAEPAPSPQPISAPPEDDDMTPEQVTASVDLALREFFGSSEGQGRIEQGDIAAIVHQHLSVTAPKTALAVPASGSTVGDVLIGAIRTGVPLAVGALLTWLAVALHIVINPSSEAALVALSVSVVSAAYYAAVKLLESKIPALGWLLGYPAAATYRPTIDATSSGVVTALHVPEHAVKP